MLSSILKSTATSVIALLLLSSNPVLSQENMQAPFDTLAGSVNSIQDELKKLKKLRISGYIQPQWQHIDSAGAASYSGGNFGPKINNRFMMRRGRVKFTYESGLTQFVLQPDISEKGLFMRETYIRITDPWINWFQLYAGCLQVQFGWELNYSSQLRETPERARFHQILFPVERDLGAFLTIQAPKTSQWNALRADFGLSNGSAGVSSEFDSHKDYTARLSFNKTSKNEKIQYALAVSHYEGGYRMGRKNEYNFGTNINNDAAFVLHADTLNFEQVALRQYSGADFQVSFDWPLGITTLRGEYIFGKQPGTSSSSTSPSAAPSSDIYHRKFDGAYFYFIQNIEKLKIQLIAKYDWYDANTQISGDQIGKSSTNTKAADLRYDTFGFGINYLHTSNVKFVFYYDMVTNETSKNLTGYTKDLKDNVFTARIQYRF